MTPGAVVAGRFEVERTARSGGMGTVYRARDLRDGGYVALKLLHACTPEYSLRFEREARLLAQLEHPGIVRHVDHGTTPQGVSWLAMEWLEGEDLADRLSRGKLTCDETATLGRRAAQTLAAAHARGVVHRDIKPSNLFLRGRDVERVTVIDFGIARGIDELRATVSGMAVGTPSYMAPEQARGARDIDLRADLFSLGCVLFECLAGRPAFEGRHDMAILAKILFEAATPLRTLRPDVPRAMERLIARMLAKSPADRPASAEEVAASLDAAPLSVTGAPPPPSLTGKEQRLVSIIVTAPLVHPEARGLSFIESHDDVEMLSRLLAPFGARLEPLADGSLIAALAGSDGAGDQAARAARCALVMLDVLPDGPLALATGRGVLHGAVPIGEAIDRAVCLLRAEQRRGVALPARVVVDAVTAGLLDGRFVVEKDGDRRELGGERDVDPDAARSLLGKSTPCVGRGPEIVTLEALFAECRAESAARAVLLTGPAGIGKSRVIHELVQRVQGRREATAIWLARGDPMGAGVSWGLVAQMIARAAQLVPGDVLETRRAKLRAHAGRVLGAEDAERVTDFLGELVGAPFPEDQRIQLRAARQDTRLQGDQIRRALEDLVAAECAQRPLLLVLEDLHWADAPSVTFLDTALRRLTECPLMVLATARPEVHDSFPRLWAERHVQEIPLRELSRKASERLARLALGESAPAATIARVVTEAAGNPFYLEELIRAAAEGKDDASPGTVLAMVQARLESLPTESRRVLRAGSVFGAAFWSGGVRALLGDPGESAEDEARIVDLEEREIIVRRRESRFPGEGEYSFRHAIVREAAYGMLTDDDLATGHRLAGGWLELAGERDATRLAEHFERGGEPARAVIWYCRAAEEALAGDDLAAAVARAERGVACGAEGENLGALRLVEAEALLWSGELARADQRAEAAAALLARGSAAWFRALLQGANAAGKLGTAERARACGEAASAAIAAGDALSAQVRCLSGCAVQEMFAGRYDAADAFLERIDHAVVDQDAIDPQALGELHQARVIRAVAAGDLGAALGSLQSALAAFEQAGDRRSGCAAKCNLGALLVELGGFAEAESALRAALAETERMGLSDLAATILQNLGHALLHMGRLDDARAVEERAIALLQRQGQARMEGGARTYLARIHLAAGDPAAAEHQALLAADRLLVAPPMRPHALAVRARALSRLGRAADALVAAEEAFALLQASGGSLEEGEALVRLVHVEALSAAGRCAEARAALVVARECVLARASRIRDPAWRTRFLDQVPDNAATLAELECGGAWPTG